MTKILSQSEVAAIRERAAKATLERLNTLAAEALGTKGAKDAK